MHPSTRPNRNSRPGGFTLIEILVVVLILAIAAAIVVPQAVQSSDVQSLAAARTLACDIEYARDLAITQAVPINVKFDVGNNAYHLRNASVDLVNPITQKGYVMSYATQAGLTKVTLVSTTFTGGVVTFDETGSPDAAGSATLQAGSWSYRIDVAAATGKVSVTAL